MLTKALHATRLGHAGLIPFVAGACGVWVVPEATAQLIGQWFIYYAVCIQSFLAGLLWSRAIEGRISEPAGRGLLNWSIIICLLAWVSLSIGTWKTIAMLMLGFYALRKVEQKWLDPDYPSWFIELRKFLTRIVLAAHFSVAVYWLQV